MMEIKDLTAYAFEKYHIEEEHKWKEFPGFSVLCDPDSGKWAALLIRQWDETTGEEVQLCDIKCGRLKPWEERAPYLGRPFRMKNANWTGVRFTGQTEEDTVFGLFDRALVRNSREGAVIVLEGSTGTGRSSYTETLLPFGKDTPLPKEKEVPAQIRQMKKLYERGDGSFRQKCRNFYLQGMLMRDYEDDAPWKGELLHYFPVYHDLGTDQLRGYFTWRTGIRKGRWEKSNTCYVYLYLYELLNGIGTASPQESLEKLQEFKTRYFGAGYGDAAMEKNLTRWMLEYAVVMKFPKETAERFVDEETRKKDEALVILQVPEAYTDGEVVAALCCLYGKKTLSAGLAAEAEERGTHLFAEIWRHTVKTYRHIGRDFFTECFGRKKAFLWHPLGNAIFFERQRAERAEYVLNPVRRFIRREGVWFVESYQKLFFNRKLFAGLIHEADRQLRLYLKTGHPLRQKKEEAWAVPFVQTVLEADRKAVEEAAKPKIVIDFAGLDRIRKDAAVTRESLLTEEEKEISLPETPAESAESLPEPEEPVLFEEINKDTEEPAAGQTSELPLNETELALVRLLLQGGDADAFLREKGLMPTILADDINEALFDYFGDSVLECEDEQLSIYEDYRRELAELAGVDTDE